MGRRSVVAKVLTSFYVSLAAALADPQPQPQPAQLAYKAAAPAPTPAPAGPCGGCYVRGEALGQVWDSAVHYYTVAQESIAVNPVDGSSSMISTWSAPDPAAVRASVTQSMFDSAMHKQYAYDPMMGTTVMMHNHTLVYPTSYLYIQYLTKYYNASTIINGQPTCIPTSSKTTLSPQILHTIFPEQDADWITTTRRRDAEDANDLKLNVLPQDAYNTLPGFEQCTFGTAIGRLTTKGPVLSMTATTISYINDVAPVMAGMGGGDHMHMNPTDTALGITGAAPGAGIPKGASPPTATAQSGTLAASGAGMDMPMPSGEKMELCDLLTVGAAVFTGTSGTFAIGEKSLTPGGPPITLFGTVVSEPLPTGGPNATASVAVVAGTTQQFLRTVMKAADLNRTARATAGGDSKMASGAVVRHSGGLRMAVALVAVCLGAVSWL